jgi:hypothetical protein
MLFLGQNLSVLVTQGLLAANLLVSQQGDTLKFLKGSAVIDQWLLFEDNHDTPYNGIIRTKKVKVSADSSHFLIFEETRHTLTDSIFTKITLYNAAQEKLWEKSPDKGRIISYSLTNVYKNLVIMVTTNNGHTNPNLDFITDRAQTRVIEEDTWHRIIDYAISPNLQYLILHVKNPLHRKMWDYIYFIKTDSHETWTYLFPICVSCKRKRIELAVYDNGKSEVVYKGEHRVFSRQGKLTDIYRKL